MDASACSVRIARPEDLLAVLGVYAQRDVDAFLPVAASEPETRAWAEMMSTTNLSVYLGEADGRALGTASLLLMPNLTYSGPTAFIEAVVVAVGHRRKGMATTILHRVLDDARSAGCNKVQLLSHKRHASDGAHRLYTALGFSPEAEGFRLYLKDVPEAVRAANKG